MADFCVRFRTRGNCGKARLGPVSGPKPGIGGKGCLAGRDKECSPDETRCGWVLHPNCTQVLAMSFVPPKMDQPRAKWLSCKLDRRRLCREEMSRGTLLWKVVADKRFTQTHGETSLGELDCRTAKGASFLTITSKVGGNKPANSMDGQRHDLGRSAMRGAHSAILW